MSKDIADLTKHLAQKYAGLDLEKKPDATMPPSGARQPKEYPIGDSGGKTAPSTSYAEGTKLWSHERIGIGSSRSTPTPKREPCLIANFTDEELEQMFATPARRGWDFPTWLEVVGLPKDLHEKLDGVLYTYAARAFLKRKDEAHRR